jgi:hypothetical protein
VATAVIGFVNGGAADVFADLFDALPELEKAI